MKKEWILMFFSVVATLTAALGVIRLMAPQLLGLPVSLETVQVDEKVPPFYENVFRIEDYKSEKFIIADPIVVRAKPRLGDFGVTGPHDILGFRNRAVPNTADVVTIGDSQTYGLNAVLENSWPGQVDKLLENRISGVYNMSCGAWGAVEYLEIFYKSLIFHPKVVVVAFYTGNDPLDSFARAYGSSRWSDLRPDPDLRGSDAPRVPFPPRAADRWAVTFSNGLEAVFTPEYRHASNMDHPAVSAGYRIMERAAVQIATHAVAAGIVPVFTIIPTKELVYAAAVAEEGIPSKASYAALVKDEQRWITALADSLTRISGAVYIDLVAPLQAAARTPAQLYRAHPDGHPRRAGYAVMAEVIAARLRQLLPARPDSGLLVKYGPEQTDRLRLPEDVLYAENGDNVFRVFQVRDGRLWRFASMEALHAAGLNLDEFRVVSPRTVENWPYGGIVGENRKKR